MGITLAALSTPSPLCLFDSQTTLHVVSVAPQTINAKSHSVSWCVTEIQPHALLNKKTY